MGVTVGINLMPQLDPKRFVDVARFVDGAGFSHLFVADSSLHAHDVYPYLTLVAEHTGNVTIGPLVTHPYTRHPAINLNAMATVNEIAQGRAVMNIGAGDRPVMELGFPLSRLAVLREAIEVMRSLSKGEAVSLEGETFRLHDAALRYGRPAMPLFVTASGPRMLELAGELADGVVFHSGSARAGIDFALEHIAAGAARSGRQLSDLTLGCAVYGALDDDLEKARAACRPIAAWFPQTSPQYARLLGVEDARIEAIRRAYRGGHFDESEEAFRMVSDEMVDAFSLAGDPALWIERFQAIQAAGADFVVVFPMVEDKVGMIERLAADVVPVFAG
jgi:5,10-methylenetetrahydromethanopterin reductase